MSLSVYYLIWMGVMKWISLRASSWSSISSWGTKIYMGIIFFITIEQAVKASVSRIRLVQHCWKISWRQAKITGEIFFRLILRSSEDRWIKFSAKAVLRLISLCERYLENILQNYSTWDVNTDNDLASSKQNLSSSSMSHNIYVSGTNSTACICNCRPESFRCGSSSWRASCIWHTSQTFHWGDSSHWSLWNHRA